MPRRFRAFLQDAERALVGVAMKFLAWALEQLVLRSSARDGKAAGARRRGG